MLNSFLMLVISVATCFVIMDISIEGDPIRYMGWLIVALGIAAFIVDVIRWVRQAETKDEPWV